LRKNDTKKTTPTKRMAEVSPNAHIRNSIRHCRLGLACAVAIGGYKMIKISVGGWILLFAGAMSIGALVGMYLL